MDSQLVLCGELRPLPRFFRPLPAFGLMIVSWALGCALANDNKADTRSGLAGGGPLAEGCVMTAKIDCPLKCDDIDFDAVCDATLGAQCDGTCAAEATGTCLDNCNSDCSIGCQGNSAAMDCRDSCVDRCGSNCETVCAGAVNPQQCQDTCGGDCRSKCAETCRATSDDSCSGTCKASCNATCSVQAHVGCQLRCSVDGYTTCKAKVAAQCVAECSSAVMLTCADPTAHPDGDPGATALDKVKADQASPTVWIHRPEDDVHQTNGLARVRVRAEGDMPVVEPPPLEAAPPTSGPDASVDAVETTEAPAATR